MKTSPDSFVNVKCNVFILRFGLFSDAPKASLSDVSYALSCFLATVTTKNPETPGQNPIRLSFVEESLDLPRSLTFSVPHEARTSVGEIPDSLYVAAYLGKKRRERPH